MSVLYSNRIGGGRHSILQIVCIALLSAAPCARAQWSGAVVNSGTTVLTQSVEVDGTATLTGGGVIDLTSTDGGFTLIQIDGDPSQPPDTAELVNVDNTITGVGFIGGGSNPAMGSGSAGLIGVINEGVIQAPTYDTLIIDPDWNRGVLNSGTVEAVAGGYLQLQGGLNSSSALCPVDNTSGFILASGSSNVVGYRRDSEVEISSVDLTGGTIAASNSGIVVFDGSSIIQNAAVTLSGSNSQALAGQASSIFGVPPPPDVTFNNVSFSGDGSAGQALHVATYGSFSYAGGGNHFTNLDNVSFLNGLTTYFSGAEVMVTGTLTNTGTIYFNDTNSIYDLSSSMYANGVVSLTGGGTLNLQNNSSSGQVIDGNYNAPDVTQNVLINQNNTITGNGFIGGTPVITTSGTTYTSAVSIINRGTILASSSDSLNLIAGPDAAPRPIENDGKMQIDESALMDVVGDFTQGSAGLLEVGLGGTFPASPDSLGYPGTYGHLDVSGTADLDGTFEVSLEDGFVPEVGDVYDVLNYSGFSGEFSDYLGLQVSPDVVLVPSYTDSGITLTAEPASSVPEPSTWTFLACGGVLLIATGRRAAKSDRRKA